MSEVVRIVEGWSGPLPFTCQADGVAVDLTGLTVTGILHDRSGTDVSTTGKVVVTTAASGIVTYTPGGTDLTRAKSPYKFRVQVVDGSAQKVFFPNTDPDLIVVYEE